jgi:hypothetical protein
MYAVLRSRNATSAAVGQTALPRLRPLQGTGMLNNLFMISGFLMECYLRAAASAMLQRDQQGGVDEGYMEHRSRTAIRGGLSLRFAHRVWTLFI